MAPLAKREEEIEYKAIHMCEGEHAQHAVSLMEEIYFFEAETDIAP